jgi:cellulose synthase/poly-beta-1,6-N-acetylglucosamine synthase-like glycosyltransferase
MSFWEITFWACAACVLYTYAGYPLLLMAAAWLRRRPAAALGRLPRSVSFVVAARDEETRIEARLDELTKLIAAAGVQGEVIVVSDGSTDRTVELARSRAKDGVRVFDVPASSGKAAALTVGCEEAIHEIIVFADTRQTWAPDALQLLLENFADPAIGAVSGNLIVETAPGVLAGVGLYWRYEKWIRRQESRVHSQVGVTGAISAVRRELFQGIPRGVILDDVYWPLRVAMQGFRVVHDSRAHAYDHLPERTTDEFRRKVRTLSGNFQLVSRLPSAVLPWRNPIWLQFISHKLMRLVVPWALLALLALSALLPGAVYRIALCVQLAAYIMGLAGIWNVAGERARLASAAGGFIVLNAAAWLGFWFWLSGKTAKSWRKIVYQAKPAEPAALVKPV